MKLAPVSVCSLVLALGGCASNDAFSTLATRTNAAAKSYQTDLNRFVVLQDRLVVEGDQRLKRMNAETASMRAGVRRQTNAWAAENRTDLVARQELVSASANAAAVAGDLEMQTLVPPALDASDINKKLSDGLKAQAVVAKPRSARDRIEALIGGLEASKDEFDRLAKEAEEKAKAAEAEASKVKTATDTAALPAPTS